MAMPSAYKPSPLGYGSPQRSSPFARPQSPVSPSPLRQSTPSGSPTKGAQATGNSRFAASAATPTSTTGSRTPRGFGNDGSDSSVAARGPVRSTATTSGVSALGHGNSLSQLQPSQVRTLREGFQILDRDSDGSVGREDVADMLTQLGLPSNPSDVSQFFPPSTQQTITMATFLNSIATALASLSPGPELLSAFSAFDDDDSGQVDLVELRDALLNTAPEPSERPLTEAEIDRVMSGFAGRRAFSSNSRQGGLGKRGEVFKYKEFVHSVAGSNGGSEAASTEGSNES